MEAWRPSDDPPDEEPSYLDRYYPHAEILEGDEHPFPQRYAHVDVTMMIEPATFLRQLVEDFHIAGGKFVIRDFASKEEILALPEDVFVNCTGLGAAQLFDDDELVPIKGQLVFMPPDPAVDYLTLGGSDETLYMFPRSDAIVLGGSYEIGDYSTHPDPAVTDRILRENQYVFSQFPR